MKRVFILKGLDCPNCSAKIKKEVGELGGVASSTVNLMNQTLTVQAGTSVATSLLDTVTTIVHSHEPDVEVSEKTEPAVTKVYLLKGLDCPNCSAMVWSARMWRSVRWDHRNRVRENAGAGR